MVSRNKQTSMGTKLGYSVAALGDACSYSFIGAFLLFFLTSVVGINPVIAGTIAAIGGIWDAIWSPVIGYISDKSTSRYGRRRPFLLAALPLGIIIVMLFSYIDTSEMVKTLYYGAMVIIFWTLFSSFFVPYLAFGAEITDDYSERTILRTYAYVFNYLGAMIGMVFPTFIVNYLCNRGETIEVAWQSASAIVGIFTTTAILVTWYCTKGKEKSAYRVHTEKKDSSQGYQFFYLMIKEYRQILKLKPIKYLIGGSIFYLIAGTMVNSDRMYFLTYNLGMEPGIVSRIYLIASVSGIIFAPLVIAISKSLDKRKAFIICSTISSVGIIIVSVAGISTFWGVIVFSFIFSLGSSCYWQLFPAMVYDVCEVDELVSGQRREGIIMSVQSLTEALASAVAVQMLGIILELSDFNGKAVQQTELTLGWIRNCFTIIPAVFMIAAIVMVVKYPVSKKRYHMVQLALQKKNRGEEYDKEGLKELI